MGEMTNEQAARWLKDLLKSDLPMEQYQTAIEKGIEALEPSGDLISREETLTAFADYVGSGMSMNDYDALWDIVTKIPSVNPQPKTGHWIWCVGSHKCSNCEEYTCFSHKELLRYCPNCGARMEDKE